MNELNKIRFLKLSFREYANYYEKCQQFLENKKLSAEEKRIILVLLLNATVLTKTIGEEEALKKSRSTLVAQISQLFPKIFEGKDYIDLDIKLNNEYKPNSR